MAREYGQLNCRERMVRLTRRVMSGAEVSVEYVMEVYGVSLATAKRDVAILKNMAKATV